MKLVIILFLAINITFLQNSFGSKEYCYKQLTMGNRQDSSHFSIDGEIDAFGNDFVQNATDSIKRLAKKLGCSDHDLNFMHGPDGHLKSSCHQFNPRRHSSISCYIETNLGFFYVSWDLQVDVHLVFNRWD